MENKSQKLLSSLRDYYNDRSKFNLLMDVITTNAKQETDTHRVSLRLIDWLVTNYSKAMTIVYEVNGRSFNIHQSYKNMLKAYSKKMFDPFRRHERVYIDNPNVYGSSLETTVAQLTFFRWAIEHDVIQYAIKHKSSIKQHMDLHTCHRTTTTNEQSLHKLFYKRKELLKGTKGASMYRVNFKVSFT